MTYLQPFFPLLIIMTLAGVLFWRNRTRVLTGSVLLLFLFSWPPAAWVPMRILEEPYRVGVPVSTDVQAMVVLASEMLPATALRPTPIPAWDTYERCSHAAWLYRQGLHVPILTTGHGTAGMVYATAMKQVLMQLGVPENMIWTEERASSTHENALYSAQILRERGISRIALVTEAFHMLRAERSFRKQGLDVVQAPCCFRSDEDEVSGWLPNYKAISYNEDAMHEFLGLIWYWMLGRI